MQQKALPLLWPASYRIEDYITDSCNQTAFDVVNSPRRWHSPVMIIRSDRFGGKTHLAHIFAVKHDAVFLKNQIEMEQFTREPADFAVIDNADEKLQAGNLSEEGLFHLINAVTQYNARLLLTASAAPNDWGHLPDLISRLNASQSVMINHPDETVMKASFQKLFTDRSLIVDDKVLDFLTTRSERSFKYIVETVALLDQLSLERSRRITVPLIQSTDLFAS